MKRFKVIVLIIGILFVSCDKENGNGEENLIFSDDFNGHSIDTKKWNLVYEADRQGGSTWKDDMVSVSDGYLRLKFKRDPALGAAKLPDPAIDNNWIRAGGIRTRKKDWSSILFENSYGYYEAKIKFPVVAGTWGAFWLMSPTLGTTIGTNGKGGTEIDIVESINSHQGKYNAALHWDGYEASHKSVHSDLTPVNIYDGEFHIFALEWTPTEYVFYVDNTVFWRVTGGAEFNNLAISNKKNYIKLTVEAASWAGTLPAEFTDDEMLVDFVKVYKQKP
jgi:beta-glucanase (GH16 family)